MNYTVCERNLLFVEDDEALKKEMIAHFSPSNAVFTASDVEEAVNLLIRKGDFDAVVLDLILKNSMGIDLFKVLPLPLPPPSSSSPLWTGKTRSSRGSPRVRRTSW